MRANPSLLDIECQILTVGSINVLPRHAPRPAMSSNLDMTLLTQHLDEFFIGCEHGELFIQQPFSVTVSRTIDDYTFEVLARRLPEFDMDENVVGTVARRRNHALPARICGQVGECSSQ